MEHPALDRDALSELAEDLGEDFTAFLERFLAEAPAALGEVDAALDAGDFAAAAARAHLLKGTAGYLGASALAACLGDLQRAAERGERAASGELAARARRLLHEVTPMLRATAGRG